MSIRGWLLVTHTHIHTSFSSVSLRVANAFCSQTHLSGTAARPLSGSPVDIPHRSSFPGSFRRRGATRGQVSALLTCEMRPTAVRGGTVTTYLGSPQRYCDWSGALQERRKKKNPQRVKDWSLFAPPSWPRHEVVFFFPQTQSIRRPCNQSVPIHGNDPPRRALMSVSARPLDFN